MATTINLSTSTDQSLQRRMVLLLTLLTEAASTNPNNPAEVFPDQAEIQSTAESEVP